MTLDKLGIQHETDKASNHHDYCKVYDHYLSSFRDKNISLIEIGVGGYQYEDRGGQSLRMWYDYFPLGKIIGIDLHNKINIANDRTEFWQGSQVDDNLFQSILEREKNAGQRIVIDDASHVNELTIKTFELIFPMLQSGDIYIVEDVHTSYFDSDEFQGSLNLSAKNTSMHYFSHLTHQLNCQHINIEDQRFDYAGKIQFIHFYKELIVLKKK